MKAKSHAGDSFPYWATTDASLNVCMAGSFDAGTWLLQDGGSRDGFVPSYTHQP